MTRRRARAVRTALPGAVVAAGLYAGCLLLGSWSGLLAVPRP